jgi:hypothetical protein
MSALSHSQVGDKQEWSHKEIMWLCNFPHVSSSTYVIISYVLKSNCDETLDNPKRCCCTVRQMMTLDVLQYSYSLMTGSATVWCCIDCINCTAVDGLEKSTNVMAVATQFVQKWNDMQGDFCTVLLTYCLAAWTNCWLCDSVQRCCCTVRSGVFCKLIQK